MTSSRGPWWCMDNKASLLKTVSTTVIGELCLTEHRMRRFSTNNTLNGHQREKTPGLSNRWTLTQAIGYTEDETIETPTRGWWGIQRLAAGKLPPPQGQRGQGGGGIAGRSILEPEGGATEEMLQRCCPRQRNWCIIFSLPPTLSGSEEIVIKLSSIIRRPLEKTLRK